MWRNLEIVELIDWMREYNSQLLPQHRAGFFGLDMYNMSAAIAQVLRYVQKVDPDSAEVARKRYGCLTPWRKDLAS
jgi:erythromycin esterase-like protein